MQAKVLDRPLHLHLHQLDLRTTEAEEENPLVSGEEHRETQEERQEKTASPTNSPEVDKEEKEEEDQRQKEEDEEEGKPAEISRLREVKTRTKCRQICPRRLSLSLSKCITSLHPSIKIKLCRTININNSNTSHLKLLPGITNHLLHNSNISKGRVETLEVRETRLGGDYRPPSLHTLWTKAGRR